MVMRNDEIEAMRHRVMASRERLRRRPAASSDREPPPDEKTGERWDRLNILGHVGEFLGFWSAGIERALAGDEFGRIPGSTGRQDAVEEGQKLGEAALNKRVEDGIEEVLALLGRLSVADLDRTVSMRGRGEVTVRWAVDFLLVGHLEEHADQLFALTTAPS